MSELGVAGTGHQTKSIWTTLYEALCSPEGSPSPHLRAVSGPHVRVEASAGWSGGSASRKLRDRTRDSAVPPRAVRQKVLRIIAIS